MIKLISTNEKKIAKVSILIILLALVRTISEPIRLQYYTAGSLSFPAIKIFLFGGLVAAAGVIIMVILYFYERYKTIILVAMLTVIAMLILKITYL